MNVRELIEKLQIMNPEAEVLAYSTIDEGFDEAGDVQPKSAYNGTDKHFPYCGGYSFKEFVKEYPERDFVIVGAR